MSVLKYIQNSFESITKDNELAKSLFDQAIYVHSLLQHQFDRLNHDFFETQQEYLTLVEKNAKLMEENEGLKKEIIVLRDAIQSSIARDISHMQKQVRKINVNVEELV